MNKITYCIPSKNNLRYLKSSIYSIKNNSSVEYDIVVYIDADNDGTEEWLIENNITYLKNTDAKPKGIAYAYNRCIEAATSEVVCMFHADMFMAKGFDTAILNHLKSQTVVSGTRIEPPLHPAGMEKIVKDFGMYPEDFNESEFGEFAQKTSFYNKGLTTKGIFAPWAIYKQDITSIGMHDESFHSYHEDSDIFNRFVISGYKLIQTWQAFVYHFTCRGGQFQDGIDKVTQDQDFHLMKSNAAKNYIRKWGSWIKNDEYHYPTVFPKYNIAYVVKNTNLQIIEFLEPWCDRLYTDCNQKVIDDYINKEQPNTKYDLTKRVLTTAHNDAHGENDIVVELDTNELDQESVVLIQQLPEILIPVEEQGTYQLGRLKVTIHNLMPSEIPLQLAFSVQH